MCNSSALTMLNTDLRFYTQTIHVLTTDDMEFFDCTDQVASIVTISGISNGILNIQSKHTTAAVIINENEPLLLNDFKRTLQRIAPREEYYLHNDFAIRTVNMTDQEDKNGHSHCKALFLPTSQILNVIEGSLDLGRWQRIFLLELDRAKDRELSIVIIGVE